MKDTVRLIVAEEFAARVDVNIGLTTKEVTTSQQQFGRNSLTPPPKEPAWKKFLGNFDDPTIRILLIAAVISLAMTAINIFVLKGESSWFDGIGILIAVMLATTVAYFNERRSEHEFELLNQIKEDIQVKVTRNGQFHTISIKEVLVGDIVHLDMGDKIPSDGRLISSINLTVDESLLTGEAEPTVKDVDPTSDDKAKHTAFPSSRVFRGTVVLDGHGRYLTTAVGDRTEMGKIAQEMKEEEEDTPLKQKLSRLANQISITGTVAAVLIFLVMGIRALITSELLQVILANPAVFYGVLCASAVLALIILRYGFKIPFKSLKFLASIPLFVCLFIFLCSAWGFFVLPAISFSLMNQLLIAFVVAVTIIVVAVPEGLPMMVNVSLALNMRKMAKENCLVRQLVASETIGSSNIICTDKTGTLTQNRMQPVWFYLGAKTYEKNQLQEAANTPEWNKVVRNIAVNSLAHIELKDGSVSGVGNPTECALLILLHNHGIDYRNLRDAHPIVNQVDYNSKRKMSLAMAEVDGHKECYLKGAPELVLARCSHISIAGKPVPIAGHREDILSNLSAATSGMALRVIAFSEKTADDMSESRSQIEDWLERTDGVFIGVIGIADPIRPEVPEAVATCKKAGINVKMVTGDDPRTAISIARQAGIYADGDLMMTSAEFSEVDESALPSLAPKISVLARSSPSDKLRLVQALHKLGNVVAVTGDGTNDAPALKSADVGLSMGKCGTEVAKEASDIVLVDDNFASIVTAVRWGRTLYANIQRFIQFQLSVNVVALLCAFVGPLMGIPLPLTVPQLLWINIIMDTLAALALSTEPSRPGIMSRPPVPRGSHIIMPSMMVTISISSLYQVVVLLVLLGTSFLGGQSDLEKLTIFFTTFVMFQFWHKFNCRSLRHDESPFQRLWQNKNFIIIVTIITLVQIIMVQVGGTVGELFRTMPLKLETWLWILLITATILPVAWLARQIAYLAGTEKC